MVITGGGVLLRSNGKGRDAATHPTTHRAAPQPRPSAPNVHRAEEEKLVEGVLALCRLCSRISIISSGCRAVDHATVTWDI